jgi:hypothetical protein
MTADQLPCLTAVLLRCTIEPVQGRGQAFGQARAAEQIQLAKLELCLRTAGTCAADYRQFFTISHSRFWIVGALPLVPVPWQAGTSRIREGGRGSAVWAKV